MIRARVVVIVLFALSVVADLFVAHYPKLGFAELFGFYAWAGLSACVASVLVARLLGLTLQRPDDYYAR